MAKVHPAEPIPSPSSLVPMLRREVFTIWMKSLVMNGNGCTVYDSDGRIVYRVDNYNYKCSDEVYLMDSCGKALTKIIRKKLRVFGRWEGYRCDGSTEERNPWFRVRNACRIPMREQPYELTDMVESSSYKIVGSTHRSEYRIKDMGGGLVAEVKRKHTGSGLALGDDVLTLVVEPNVEHLLIMGLVIVWAHQQQHLNFFFFLNFLDVEKIKPLELDE